MTKYFVFAGFDYYPAGGSGDFVRMIDAASDEDAIASLESEMPDGNDWAELAKLEAEELTSVGWWRRRDKFKKPPHWHRITVS